MEEASLLERSGETALAGAPFGSSLARAFRAQLSGTWRPRSAMRGAESIPLRAAWLSHLVTLVLGIAAMLVAGAGAIYLVFVRYEDPDVHGYFDYLGRFFRGFIGVTGSLKFWIVAAVILVAFEITSLLLALLTIAWPGVAEPTSRRIRHSLRTVWLLTPLPLCFCFASWLCVILFEIPLVRSGVYSASLRAWMDFAFYWALTLLAAWALWVLLRACSARPELARVKTCWCESCGYDLSATSAESRCPECGQPAADSIDPGLRLLTPWADGQRGGVSGRYLGTLFEVTLRPSRFFRHMPVWSGQREACSFLMVSAVLTGLLAALPFLMMLTWRNMLDVSNLTFLSHLPAMHVGCMLGIVLIVSGLFGAVVSWMHGRPLLVPVSKVFFYLSGIYVLLIPGWWLFVILLEFGWLDFLAAPDFLNLPRWARINLGLLAGLATIPAVLAYLFIVHARGIRQVLYANK